MRITAKNTIVNESGHHCPGEEFECQDDEAEHLIELGAAEKGVDRATNEISLPGQDEKIEEDPIEPEPEAEPIAARPDDPDLVKTEILEAMRQAKKAGNVTSRGKPTVEAIEEILGWDISSQERDQLMDVV